MYRKKITKKVGLLHELGHVVSSVVTVVITESCLIKHRPVNAQYYAFASDWLLKAFCFGAVRMSICLFLYDYILEVL